MNPSWNILFMAGIESITQFLMEPSVFERIKDCLLLQSNMNKLPSLYPIYIFLNIDIDKTKSSLRYKHFVDYPTLTPSPHSPPLNFTPLRCSPIQPQFSPETISNTLPSLKHR